MLIYNNCLFTQLSTWVYNYYEFNVLGSVLNGFIILQAKPVFWNLFGYSIN